jgi:hypothetical protein
MTNPIPTCNPITPADLVRSLANIIGDLLGNYTYEGGQTLPAIAIGHRGDRIEVSGLEVIVDRIPRYTHQGTTSGVHTEQYWGVRLAAHRAVGDGIETAQELDDRTYQNLAIATKRILLNYIVANNVFLPANYDYDVPEQVKITIKYYEMLFPDRI